jgi:DNA modification methylase
VAELLPADYNPRKITEAKKEELKKSLEKLGMIMPIVINTNNKVVGGHQRLSLMADLGIIEVDVRVPDRELTAEEEKEANLTTNISKGEWDWSKLIGNFEFDLLIDAGFSEKEVSDQMDFINLTDDKKEEFDIDKELEKIKEPIIKKGDIFILGNHRLMCGDSVDLNDVQELMKGDLAKMIFTDPPYNVNYKGAGENTSEVIKNDNLTPEQFEEFMIKVFESMNKILMGGGSYYVCSGWSSYPSFYKCIQTAKMYFSGVIIWVKDNASYGWNDYRYKHEWIAKGKKVNKPKAASILYGWKEGTHYFRDTRDEYDVWDLPRKASSKYVHPTEKPEWLIMKAVKNSSLANDIVADLFGGSGSTLMACHKSNRVSYSMELDAKYCQVILERWLKYTKQEPKLEKTGQSWSEIKAAI